MNSNAVSLLQAILGSPLFRTDWVLWLLILLSIGSLTVMVERALFFRRRRIDIQALRKQFSTALKAGNYQGAASALQPHDTLETNAVLFGLLDHASGPDAVEDLVAGATQKEKERYDARLSLLATIASTAPFIGLFGTVLGIIHAFKDLSANIQDATSGAMSGVSEALVTTAAGLFVAIPALVAFNYFKGKVRGATANAQFLSRILLAHLKATS